ncbi:MAG: MurR/RpiR family transcriptional regulator [Erysipelotrichaceae bacterium]
MEDFMTNINLKKNTLTKNELRACEAILDHLTEVQTNSFTELSDSIGVTKASIMRFCQKIGYSGYNEFKYECVKYVNSIDHLPDAPLQQHHTAMEKVTSVYAELLPLIHKTTAEEHVLHLISLIKQARKVYAVGVVNSSLICMQVRYAFLMFGYDVAVISSEEELRTIDMILNEEDLLLVFSVSATSNIMKLIHKVKENQQVKLALVTMNPEPAHLENYEEIIYLPSASNLKSQSLLDSVPIYTVFVEILIYLFHKQ